MKIVPGPVMGLLREASSAGELESVCREMVEDSPYVSVSHEGTSAMMPLLADPEVSDFSWLFDPASRTPADRLFDAALNASLNGGYFHRDGGGLVVQWERRGSGSRALEAWIASMRSEGMMPGQPGTGGDAWRERMRNALEGQPYAGRRLAVLEAFCSSSRRTRLDALTDRCLEGGRLSVRLPEVDAIADLYPEGLREDPLRKKAILSFLILAGSLHSEGMPVEWDALFPSDYQLPRVCAWKGALLLSEDTLAALRDPRTLLPVDSAMSIHVRAATIVVGQDLSRRSGLPSWVIDMALFNGFRRFPSFAQEAPPPMRIDGDWF